VGHYSETLFGLPKDKLIPVGISKLKPMPCLVLPARVYNGFGKKDMLLSD
jgi:hypothetical protein